MKRIASALPDWIKTPLVSVRNYARAVPYYGDARFCPVCGKTSSRFRAYGAFAEQRPDAQCPHCSALERHRFLWLYLTKKTDLFDGKQDRKILHVAPESCLEPRLRHRLGKSYITADLENPRAMVKMDITNIQYPDQWFDVIYCSHVLEHVPDDRKAINEFHRVLKDNGWAILLVPVTAEETYEDPSIVDPQARLAAFGHKGHVRRYGPDFADRLRQAGFHVEVTTVEDMFDPDEAERMGLTEASGEIYYCTK